MNLIEWNVHDPNRAIRYVGLLVNGRLSEICLVAQPQML